MRGHGGSREVTSCSARTRAPVEEMTQETWDAAMVAIDGMADPDSDTLEEAELEPSSEAVRDAAAESAGWCSGDDDCDFGCF